MKHEIERYLPFPLLMWRVLTQPFWNLLARVVDFGLRIYLRKEYGVIERRVYIKIVENILKEIAK